MQNSISDKILMSEIANGSELAFRHVYQKFGNKLFRFFLRLTHNNQSQSEDLLQELFIQIHLNAHKYRSEYQLSTWIYSIATNLVRNSTRNDANRIRILTESYIFNQAENHIENNHFENKQMANLIYEYAESIDKEGAYLLYLRYQEEFQLSEIALVMKMPLGTVKSKLHYLMKKISEKFKLKNYGIES